MPSSQDSSDSAQFSASNNAKATGSTVKSLAPERWEQKLRPVAVLASRSFNNPRLAQFGFLVVCLVFGRLALGSGVTWDEGVQREYGDLILAWFRSGFEDQRALSFHNLYFYGGLFEAIAQFTVGLLPTTWGEYEIRHVLNALSAAFGVAAIYLSGARLVGRGAGFLAGALLASTPTWVGHGFFNSKDIPFGTAVAFVLFATTRISMADRCLRWSDAILAGAAMGAALGIRPGGVFVALFPTAAAAVQAFWSARAAESRRQATLLALQTLARILCSYAIAWAIMISAWPWAQLQPFTRPFIATAEAAHFHWGGNVLFRGESIPSDLLPWTYVPVWFAITLPEMYLIAGVCAIAYSIARAYSFAKPGNRSSTRLRSLGISLLERSEYTSQLLAIALASAFVWIPWIGILVTKPVMYNAHRHVLFLFPPVALCAGLIIHRCIIAAELTAWLRVLLVAALLVTTGVTWRTMLRLQPYEYIYFNRFVGGLARAGQRYDTDYWGNAYREALAWVVAHGTPAADGSGGGESEDKQVLVDACHFRFQLAYYIDHWQIQDRFALSGQHGYRRYYMAFPNEQCAHDGELVHQVKRSGIPLMNVYEYPSPPPVNKKQKKPKR